MRSSTRVGIALAVASAAAIAAGCSMHHPPQPAAKQCLNDQSPRRLENYGTRPTFFVERAPAGEGDAFEYTRRSDGRHWLLKRCGQHYHCQVENVQPTCRDQQGATRECGAPAPDSWVEIHTLYAEKMATGSCDPEATPGCCETEAEGDPILVLAFHAKVTSGGSPVPIPLPWGGETARWSGSTTGTNEPLLCKPAAQWSFILGCNFTVSEQQLGLFHHIEQARPLQLQLSDDLARETPR